VALLSLPQVRSALGSPYQNNDQFMTYLPMCG